MSAPDSAAAAAAERIISTVRQLLAGGTSPVVVALDGPSGSGKSTLAEMLTLALAATVVPTDDFFAADITDAGWDARSPQDRAADAIDWRRLRREAIDRTHSSSNVPSARM